MSDPAVVAVTTDLIDRSRISGAFPDARVVGPADELADADVVLVDTAVSGAVERAVATGARVIAYGSHVDEETLGAARALGAEAMPRSRFFRRLGEGTLLTDR